MRPNFYCPATRRMHPDLPAPGLALREPNGLLAIGGDLHPATLREAYRCGVFPWYSPGQPIMWWSPDPRVVLRPARFRASRRLLRTIRVSPWRITIDCAFEQVIAACAAPRKECAGTWITPEMIDAYIALHREGIAHSVECWLDGRLAGGLYGVAVGKVFCAESMFSAVRDGSKIALFELCRRLVAWNFEWVDCQIESPHLRSLGAEDMARDEFCAWLSADDNAGVFPRYVHRQESELAIRA